MCFTVNVNLVKEELESRYGKGFIDHENYRPSYYYHAFALPQLPVITAERISLMRWGLIPEWAGDFRQASEIRMKTFNARSETIDTKPSFASSYRYRRCIIPVSGFYEWQHTPSGKIPWYIASSTGSILSLGGIWSGWSDSGGGEVLQTFSIVTTVANDLMSEIHNSGKRMPMILSDETTGKWLDGRSSDELLKSLMIPAGDDVLSAYTIGPLINRRDADKNRPEIIKPYSYQSYGTLFD